MKKKIIKKIILTIGVTNCLVIFLATIIMVGVVGIIGEGNKKSYSNITDIGAMGVPLEFVPYFNETSELVGIPNWVLCAIAKQESNFNPNDEYGGAYGIMQQQRYDFSGDDIFKYYMDYGLADLYRKVGYEFNSIDDMWSIFLKDARAQIIAGGFETMYYANYVLYRKGIINTQKFNNVENMKLIDWGASETDSNFRELLRRIFACYNGGQGYGMDVDLDKAQNNYPNSVFKYAMEFRNAGITGSGIKGDNETIEKAIEAGMKWVGKSPYVWGGGRNQADVDAGRFDCSSLVHYCYSNAGIQLGDRSSVTTWSLLELGRAVSPSEMKRGDLLFFDTAGRNGHVGIWLGDGKFLNDSSSKGVSIGDLNSPYWKSNFNGNVRRIIE
ncbi:C40 family peptidase [Clostridium perfringens]|uniref:bifunctional lysozyme/C40 family peptidase n=2 Tax=Clostridium perfringens TaxID=1502 RepID=UPI000D70FD52|nr:C40 family peptidase [Clostridium perfringens]MCX0374662.1 C40 family peptidase [Clostridium perfringens]MDM0635720.1 C40 family peptidase [Clostridium perfringens]NGT31829.1 cell wall-binding protein [Clostridium perfringens]NGU09549.1 cell wall-binding protein [Clostridium perfringens]PWW84772.1 cell wall-binding protein [Clostridium perfringens]